MIKPGSVAIVGAAESEEIGVVPGVSSLGLHADASLRAIADAGLNPSDIDGIATVRPYPNEVAHYLGIEPRWMDGTMVGGCSFLLHVRHAAAALSAGLCEAVLISHGESGRSRVGEPVWRPVDGSAFQQFEMPYGAVGAPLNFTVPALRFLEERGMSDRDLAEVVVSQRRWAKEVPRALRRELVTVEQVLGDRMIAYPFTRAMCCPITDGGAALVMVRSERVADLRSDARPVYLLGAGEATDAPIVSQMGSLSSFAGFRRAGEEALTSGGVTRSEIDHLMIYDAFAHLPLYGLEDLGFVGFGESAAFVADGGTSPGGELPLNTNGGGLCYTHTGMYGMFAIQESVRQLRGAAAAQVDGLTVGMVVGVGMFFAVAGALILSTVVP